MCAHSLRWMCASMAIRIGSRHIAPSAISPKRQPHPYARLTSTHKANMARPNCHSFISRWRIPSGKCHPMRKCLWMVCESMHNRISIKRAKREWWTQQWRRVFFQWAAWVARWELIDWKSFHKSDFFIFDFSVLVDCRVVDSTAALQRLQYGCVPVFTRFP